MSDLVKRLRATEPSYAITNEAAARIERLEEALRLVCDLAGQEWSNGIGRYSAKGNDGRLLWFISEDVMQAARAALQDDKP